jgi:predicted nucleic acid-binding Zn ribbon protein
MSESEWLRETIAIMPVYIYEVVRPDGSSGDTFEVLQNMNDEPLTVHPETAQPVRRVLTAPNVMGKYSETRISAGLSNKNLAAKGFTKYVKTGDGKYEKATGSGPDRISADGVG